MSVIDELTQVLAQRKCEDPNTSYVASLHAKGLNKILEKAVSYTHLRAHET